MRIGRRFFTVGGTSAVLSAMSAGSADSAGATYAGLDRRTIAVSVEGGPRFGAKTYAQSLPLADGELILTFDDGPLPATTGRVLDALAAANMRATFFLIGRNARAHPAMVRRIVAAGHTLANHTLNHPWTMRQLSFAAGLREIDEGRNAIEQASGQRLAPFFRFPGFADTPDLLAELSRRNVAVWGADLWASDWNPMTASAQLDLLHARVRKARRGIILMHDTRAQTAQMLPAFLTALGNGGYRIVHAVPA